MVFIKESHCERCCGWPCFPETNYFHRCLALEHLYNLQGMSFVGPCSFMTNVSLLPISNSKLTVDMFGKVLPGGSYPTLKAWTRDLSPGPEISPLNQRNFLVDTVWLLSIMTRLYNGNGRWRLVKGSGQCTNSCQAEVDSGGSLQTRGDLAPR